MGDFPRQAWLWFVDTLSMTLPPPPTGSPVAGGRSARRVLRDIGLLIALSAPVSGFFVWIIVAVLVGEDRLEGQNGQTALGLALFAVPVVIGLSIAGWAQFARKVPQLPKLNSVAKVMIAMGWIAVAAGFVAIVTASDASIGGALLLMAGVVVCGAGVALYGSSRNR